MNQITQIINNKLWKRYKSPMYDTPSSPRNVTVGSQSCYTGWSTKVLGKVKECRNAIKTIVTFDKAAKTNGIARTGCNNTSNNNQLSNYSRDPKSMISSSSVPDIVRCNRISATETETEFVEIRNSSNGSETSVLYSQKRRISASFNPMGFANNNMNESFSSSLPDYGNNSTQSFLALEKQIEEEYEEEAGLNCSTEKQVENEKARENVVTSVKKKISAAPFLIQASSEFWDSSDNSSPLDLTFDDPRQSSTFCEDFDNNTSSLSSSFALQDSGYENNFSISRYST